MRKRNASMFFFLHQEVPKLIELQPTRSWGFFRFSDAVNHALYMKLRRLATRNRRVQEGRPATQGASCL